MATVEVGGPVEARPGPTANRWVVLAVLCVSLLMVSLDDMILNVALPTIVRDLHASSSDLQWMVDGYVIVFAGLLLVAGSLGDRLGRKWVFMVGLALFACGSAASAFSPTSASLIASRAFMGVGAAAVMPSTLSILTNVFTAPLERARAIGIWSGTTGLGVAIGPMAGGWLLAHFWWGSVFLVNVPIAAIGLLAAARTVPNSKNPAYRRPDPVGATLSIAGMGVLLWGIIEAPERSWTSPLTLGAVAGGIVVIGAFVAWERRCDHRMLELSFFRSRQFSAAIGAMALVIFALMGALFLLTQYLQFSLGYSPLQTGLRVAPIAVVLLVVAPASILLVRLAGTKVVVCCGMGLIAVGLVLLARTTVAGTYDDALPAFFLLGIGTGLSFAPCTTAVMSALPPEQAGIGSATDSAAIQTGGALGVAVMGSLLNTRYQGAVAPLLAHVAISGSIRDLVTGSLGGALQVAAYVGGHLGDDLAALARSAFVSGMDLGLLAGAGAAGLGMMIVLVFLPNQLRTRAPGKAADDDPSLPAPGPSPLVASGHVVHPGVEGVGKDPECGSEY